MYHMATNTDSGHKIYIIDYWVPFPSSEYGGIIIVKATSVEDAINVIKHCRWEYGMDHESEMIECVKDAKWYEIKGSHKSELVQSFTT